MSVVATIAAVVLGLLFVLSGAAKVARRGQWLTDAAALGTPRPVAVVVPWVEIALGALLVARVGLPWTAVAVLVLLAAFNGLLLVRLDDDVRLPCACFGAWSARPVSWWSVGRNVALGVLALVAMQA